MNEGFHFFTQHHLVELLPLQARDVSELLEGMRAVPASSIYFHTHRFLQQHHYLSPEPPNDFAYWLRDVLRLERLGEAFLAVDTISFTKLESLRQRFVEILEEYLARYGNGVTCPEGRVFYFMSCQTFVLPTPYVAHTLLEFAELLSQVSVHSLYFHMFQARMRLGNGENDFSAWLKGLGKDRLAQEIARLDPYNITFEHLRRKIVERVLRHARD